MRNKSVLEVLVQESISESKQETDGPDPSKRPLYHTISP